MVAILECQLQNYFSTSLVKIHLMASEVLSVSCFVLILSNSKWWPSWRVQLQKIEMASCNNCSGTKLDQFQSRVLSYCHFHI